MAQNFINAEKGYPFPVPLTFAARISPNVLYNMRRGQVGQLNSSGEIEPGVSLWNMGLFLFGGATDTDVNRTGLAIQDGGGANYWYPISPSGRVGTFVAKGNYELATSEYNKLLTYTSGQPLKSPTGNTLNDGAVNTGSGLLTNASVAGSTTNVVGVVSKGVQQSPYGMPNAGKLLVFWPVWFPAWA